MIRRFIKASVAGTLYHTGLLRFGPFSQGRDAQAVILMYHRVVPTSSEQARAAKWLRYRSLPGIVVSPEMFEHQLRYLRRQYRIISLEDLAELLAAGQDIPPKSVVITFDDGWRDNFEYAFPILKELDVPATIFLTAEYIGTEKLFWPEKVIALFDAIEETNVDYPDLSGMTLPHDVASAIERIKQTGGPDRDEAVGDLIERIKLIDRGLRDELIARLEAATGTLPKHRVMLNWEEVSSMQAEGVSFGSHGLSHEIMTEIDEDRLREELTRSKAVIEERLGRPCLTLAYPNGNHDDRVRRLTEEAGYRCAVAVKSGTVRRDSDLFALNRFNLHENASRGLTGGFSPSQFAFRLSGI